MSDHKSPFDGDAPLLPGGEPELAGTGPEGAYKADDGSVSPEDVPDENPREGDDSRGAESQREDER